MTTVDESLDADPSRPEDRPGDGAGERGRRPRPSTVLGVLALVVAIGLIAASSIDVPYYAIGPGSARSTNALVKVPDERRVPPKGELLFVTVNVARLRALGWLLARFDDDTEIVDEAVILGTTPKGDYDERTAQEMVDAKQTAAVVALDRLCYQVTEGGTGARISQVVEGSPAAAAGLAVGEVITAVGGAPTTTSTQAVAALQAGRPGQQVQLTVEPPRADAPARTVVATLGARDDAPGRAYLGVATQTRQQRYQLPFPVTIDTGAVGGPSAGLEFSLSIIDQLTPGELTGGRRVAVTGTIGPDGSVGPVGGVPQKAATVRKAGAKLFLVPASQVAEARTTAGDVEVVGVGSLQEALTALGARGGDTSVLPASC